MRSIQALEFAYRESIVDFSDSVVPRPFLLRRDLAGEEGGGRGGSGSDGEEGRGGEPTESQARSLLSGPG